MNSMSRRCVPIGVGLALGLSFLAGPPAAQAARSRAKAKAKTAAKSQAITSKVSSYADGVLRLQSGRAFRVLPTTKVLISRGRLSQDEMKEPFFKDDPVTITSDGKGNAATIKVAPPARLKNGSYTVLGQTSYTPLNKVVALIWLVSADKKRYLVQVDEATTLTGEGMPDGAEGPQAIKADLRKDAVVEVTLSSKPPYVDRYGDWESPYCVNGLAKSLKVTQVAP